MRRWAQDLRQHRSTQHLCARKTSSRTAFRVMRYTLTTLDFPKYIGRMDAELKALEERIGLLVSLTERLRTENGDLRQQVATAQTENRQLREKVDAARDRLASLLDRIPQGD
jgi:cell division protein ZapB